ncbi:MAG: EamA family transporter RarD [Burkholderiaceae bacterium]|nr:EamA family transporter RarD [Microbacteriaceae bacterium]
MPESSPHTLAATRRTGFIQAVSAYTLWGFLPVYFLLLAPSGPFEIVAARILFSLVFCAVLLTATRKWATVIAIARQPKLLLTIGLAGAFIYVNWQVFLLAVLSGRVLEGALGYFINPIVTVLLGVVLLRERLRPVQWVAVGISLLAVLVLAIGYGTFPWISLTLAFSFGFYGLLKKRVGPRVDAVSGLSLETAWLLPVAIIQLAIVGGTTGLTIGSISPWHTLAIIGSGVITAVPLLLFAGAARRLPLITLGLVQYLAPLLQFVFGAFLLGEAMPPERWIGFALVWAALVLLTIDMLISGRAARRMVPLLT